MTNKDYQVSELVENARTGDKASMEQLVNLFHEDIYRTVYYRTHSRMDAEDLTQEIFMQMIKSLPGLKNTACFKSWLFRIALNRVRDFHRKKSILRFLGTTTEVEDAGHIRADNHNTPADRVMQKEFWKQFRQFTDTTLSRWEREVFILRFLDHMGIREIADVLKKNESTVKTHLYRALKKFRQNPGLHDLLKGELL